MSEALMTTAVKAVIQETAPVDRQARIAELEKQLAKVQKDIAEEERVEKRCALIDSAYEKLRREMGKTLTREEYEAIDGAYLFLHSGCVDLVRHIPSATSKGEDKRLEKDLATGEALEELKSLIGAK